MSYEFTRYLKELAGVNQKQLQEFEGEIQKRSIEKDEILLHKGHVCDHFFFVEEGLLRFYSIDKDGKEHILEFAP